MHWCASTVIPGPYVDALLLEVIQRNRLVTLGGHVHHVDAVVVLRRNICAVLQQEVTEDWIALEAGKVESGEAIGGGLEVNPVSEGA